MNLYQYHNNPDVLPGHHKKHELLDTHSPKEFFERYKNRPDELKKRESAIAKFSIYSKQYSDLLGTRFPLGEPAIFSGKGFDCMFYLNEYPECMKDYPESFIAKNEVLSYWYSDLILKARFPLGEPIMLSKYDNMPDDIGDHVFEYIKQYPECLKSYPKEEMAKSASLSYGYSLVLKARFPLGEPIMLAKLDLHGLIAYTRRYPEAYTAEQIQSRINKNKELDKLERIIQKNKDRLPVQFEYIVLTDIKLAMKYKDKFPDAFSSGFDKSKHELEISKDAQLSYKYATEFLKARFPLGEPVILTNASLAVDYKIEFPDAFTSPKEKQQLELEIAKDERLVFVYATKVLKARFPLGEPAILTGAYGRRICTYKISFMDAFTSPKEKQQMELAISKDGSASYDYAIKVLKARFKLGEPAIKSRSNTVYWYERQFPDAFK